MRELILDGAIGQVKAGWCRHFVGYGGDAYFKDWHADRSKSTSLLLQKGAHDIDVLHWLCGGYTARVNALGGLVLYDRIKDRHSPKERGDASWRMENWPPLSQKGLNPVIDVEDVSMMLMQLDNGVFASYQQCHFTPDGWRNYTIIGTEGRIENVTEDCIKLWNRRTHCNPFGDEQFYLPPLSGSHGGVRSEHRRGVRRARAVRQEGDHLAGGGPVQRRRRLHGGAFAAARRDTDERPEALAEDRRLLRRRSRARLSPAARSGGG